MSHISNKVPAKVRRLVEKINRRWPPRCISCQCLILPELALISESGARYCEKCFPLPRRRPLIDLQMALERFSWLAAQGLPDEIYDCLKADLAEAAVKRFRVLFEDGRMHLIRELAAALDDPWLRGVEPQGRA